MAVSYATKSQVPHRDKVGDGHPDFRCMGANPAGYPFHGNDLPRELLTFSHHASHAGSRQSDQACLKSYGQDVLDKTIRKIISIWQDL
jgi:hypothetical protein